MIHGLPVALKHVCVLYLVHNYQHLFRLLIHLDGCSCEGLMVVLGQASGLGLVERNHFMLKPLPCTPLPYHSHIPLPRVPMRINNMLITFLWSWWVKWVAYRLGKWMGDSALLHMQGHSVYSTHVTCPKYEQVSRPEHEWHAWLHVYEVMVATITLATITCHSSALRSLVMLFVFNIRIESLS